MLSQDYRRIARQRLQDRWLMAVLVCFLASLLGGAAVGSFSLDLKFNFEQDSIPIMSEALWSFFADISSISSAIGVATFFIGGPVSVGYSSFLMRVHDGEEADFKELFSAFGNFLQSFLMHLLSYLFIFLWALLFIIPGIMASYSYAMAPYIMAEHPDIPGRDAITASKELMYGHRWALFCLDCSFIGWHLLGLISCGIGTLFVAPYHNQARAAFYRQLIQDSRSPMEEFPDEGI